MSTSIRNLSIFTAVWLFASVVQAAEIRDIFFPTTTNTTFSDDFGDQRSGHTHEGIDILGHKMDPLYSAVDGVVDYLVFPEASYGYEIVIRGNDGYTYHYIHVNNDTPGTDDGMGGRDNAYAPGMAEGVHVTRGELVAYMGDSGNAESVGPHLHFEIRLPNGTAIDPYESLVAARYKNSFSASIAMSESPDINTDRSIVSNTPTNCTSGSRIKTKASTAVYYCGADGKRYVFPNDRTYFSWYPSFTGITTVTSEVMATVAIGGNVTYRPGVRMVKILSDPKVYAVDRGGVLRFVVSEEAAIAVYGTGWAKKVDDLSDAFFVNYTVGRDVDSAR